MSTIARSVESVTAIIDPSVVQTQYGDAATRKRPVPRRDVEMPKLETGRELENATHPQQRRTKAQVTLGATVPDFHDFRSECVISVPYQKDGSARLLGAEWQGAHHKRHAKERGSAPSDCR